MASGVEYEGNVMRLMVFLGEVVCRYLILKGSNRYRNIKEPVP